MGANEYRQWALKCLVMARRVADPQQRRGSSTWPRVGHCLHIDTKRLASRRFNSNSNFSPSKARRSSAKKGTPT